MIRLLLLSTIVSISAFGLPKRTPPRANHRTSPLFHSAKKSFVDKIFDQADTNKDGSVDLAETYELVLKLYVQLNRQAPINPPNRETVRKIFQASDIDKDRRISRDEFNRLARILGRRAMSRLVAHKAVTLVGAPLLAEYAVRKLKGRAWLHKAALKIVPEKHLPTSVSFYRTFLIIFLVATLGNIVLGVVNFTLDFRNEVTGNKRKQGGK